MWDLVLGKLSKLSVVASLREQLVLEKAKGSELKSEVQTLKAQLASEQSNHSKTSQELQKLQAEHEEEVRIWDAVEFRRGKRTFDRYKPFCPKCHMPLYGGGLVMVCSGNCGWSCNMKPDEASQVASGFNHTEGQTNAKITMTLATPTVIEQIS